MELETHLVFWVSVKISKVKVDPLFSYVQKLHRASSCLDQPLMIFHIFILFLHTHICMLLMLYASAYRYISYFIVGQESPLRK